MDLTSIPRRNPEVTHQMVEDEAILVNINNGNYYSLNDTGAMFWKLLDGQRTIAACAQEIAADYDVEPEMVEADLMELADQFAAEGLIVV